MSTLLTTEKNLNDSFESFGEALSAFARFVNGEHDEINNGNMVKAFLKANKLPIFELDTGELIPKENYFFESTEWLSNFLYIHNFFQYDYNEFIGLDDSNRPIARIIIDKSDLTNLKITGVMSKGIYEKILNAFERNVKVDPLKRAEEEKVYYEVISSNSIFGNALSLDKKTVQHTGFTHPAFYPYLDGGIEELIEDFIKSDETVLIIMGEPGTGKSTAISAAASKLNLLPIYAKKTEVLTDPSFISSIFKFSDDYMEKAVSTNVTDRLLKFKERDIFDSLVPKLSLPPVTLDTNEKIPAPKMPIVVIEDGDLLIAPRSEGNEMMSELLNETDGVGSAVTRKLLITTNLTDTSKIDAALMRDGRHYLGQPLHFRLLNPMEAIEARAAAGLPRFEVTPTEPISLAKALRKPRKKIYIENGEVAVRDYKSLN